jgi:L-fucose mutarotase/ribose pyranase (RbsD/FucU family)
MADKNSKESSTVDGIVEGLDKDDGSLTAVIKAVLSRSKFAAAVEATAFLKRLVTEETPEERDTIMEMSEDELFITMCRINLFEKLRLSAVDDDQLDHLYQRTIDIWGEAPTEPKGRLIEWNLWVTRHRRRNGIRITEVIEGDKTVDDIKQRWIERHQAREERRKLREIQNYDQYEVPEDAPSSYRHLLFSPFLRDEDDLPDVDIEQGEVEELERTTESDHS